jgi:hypothetical protein
MMEAVKISEVFYIEGSHVRTLIEMRLIVEKTLKFTQKWHRRFQPELQMKSLQKAKIDV